MPYPEVTEDAAQASLLDFAGDSFASLATGLG
jgi:hypothetical protein